MVTKISLAGPSTFFGGSAFLVSKPEPSGPFQPYFRTRHHYIQGDRHLGIRTAIRHMASQITQLLEKALHFWNAVPQPLQYTFAALGALYVLRGALSFVRLLLNSFILSGPNVGGFTFGQNYTRSMLTSQSRNSFASMARRAPGPSSPVRLMVSARSSPLSSPPRASTSSSSPAPSLSSMLSPRSCV